MFNPQAYTLIASLFPKLLGLIYLVAHGALIFQIKGLIGAKGILPLCDYLSTLKVYSWRKRLLYAPTLFWIYCSDLALIGATGLGVTLSVLLILGFSPAILLLCLYLLHFSLMVAGQDFLSFGWESLLLEITLYAFLMSLTPVPNLMIWIGVNFLLFRFHFQAGLIKLQTRDISWRNLTAIAYHYQTQPIPNAIAWYIHKLPLWVHKGSVLATFFTELIAPFGIFGPDWMRLGVFIAFFTLQFSIWLTGNFSYLNQLTAVFSTILIGNAYLACFFSTPPISPSSFALEIFLSVLGAFLLFLQIARLWDHLWPTRLFRPLLFWAAFFHFANRHAIFGSMTTKRYEIVIEGSHDGQTWQEYLFWYKPSELTRRPRWISPYQPRLDWQAWFLPFHNFYDQEWFQSLLYHLLKGTKEVLKLLRGNPFQDHPPTYIRAKVYEYEFSSAQEKKEKGWWWRRRLIGPYSPTLSLKGMEKK